MQNYMDLRVWRKAHRLVLEVYRHTQRFPVEERYVLTSQLRRAAISVPSNISEGCGRNSQPQLYHFLEIALGSAAEVQYQLLLARDLHYLDEEVHHQLKESTEKESTEEVKRMLAGLMNSVGGRRG